MLPFRGSEESVKPSTAFSKGYVCVTNFLISTMPPAMQEMAAGQVSVYRLMKRNSI